MPNDSPSFDQARQLDVRSLGLVALATLAAMIVVPLARRSGTPDAAAFHA